jgi:uncharacterized phage-like protein YoqJ
MDTAHTCCFTGHRPEKLPWGDDGRDPRCLALKNRILREVGGLYRRGYQNFVCGMARGCDLYFAEAVLALRETYPTLTLEAALPYPGQADRWPEQDRLRWQELLARCDQETVVCPGYTRHCMHLRDRYMVERSSAVLAVFDGTPGGTRYTLNYAMDRQLEVLLVDPARPESPAVRLTV